MPSRATPFLTDAQWALIHPLLPPPAARGRLPLDDRLILDAILYKILTASPWYDLPAVFPSHQTCFRRYRFWRRRGLLRRIYHVLLDDLRSRGGFDLLAAHASGDLVVAPRQPGGPSNLLLPPGLGDWQRRTALLLICWALRDNLDRSLRKHPSAGRTLAAKLSRFPTH